MNNRIYPKGVLKKALDDYLEQNSFIEKTKNREKVIDKILKEVDKDMA